MAKKPIFTRLPNNATLAEYKAWIRSITIELDGEDTDLTDQEWQELYDEYQIEVQPNVSPPNTH
jgi:hypothetical protein